jgi:hypothetical protein
VTVALAVSAALLPACSGADGVAAPIDERAREPAESTATAAARPTTAAPTASRRPRPKSSAYAPRRSYRPVAAPVSVRIPAAHVDSALDRLGLAPDGSIAVPENPARAGWFTGGSKPGQPGPAVLLGHVDGKSGPAVFFHVAKLRKGDKVYVDRADGSTARFRVTRLVRTRKTAFPTDDVYAPTLEPGLRLVTCGGTFDHATGHYRDNVIVFAAPA